MEVQKADGVLKEVKWRQKSEIGATTFPLEIILDLCIYNSFLVATAFG